MSLPVQVNTLLTSAQPTGDSRVDSMCVTPKPPPAYGCVRPLPKYLMSRGPRGRDGRVESHAAVEVARGLLRFGECLDAPAGGRFETHTAADRHADTDVAFVVPELDHAGRGEDFDGLGRRKGWNKKQRVMASIRVVMLQVQPELQTQAFRRPFKGAARRNMDASTRLERERSLYAPERWCAGNSGESRESA